VRETTIHAAADLTGESRARFGATAYPMAVITSRRTAPQNHAVRATLEPGPGGIPQSQLGSGPWIIGRQDAGALAARIQREHPAFGSRLACRLGVKTGANEVFLDPDEVERELLRPAVRGRDVGPFRAAAGGRILWTHDSLGAPLPKLPPLAAAHLSRHEAMLRSRRDYAGG